MKGITPNLRSVTDTAEFGTRRRLWWLVVILIAISSVLALQAASARADSACPAGATMNIVAHPDDDLLFQSPDLLHDVQSGKCVRTVYMTAGERGGRLERLHTRESGVEAGYAQMAGVANSWTTTDAGIPGHPMPLVTLTGRPTVSLVFMRLPEGFWGDRGTARSDTLQNLWLGNVSEMHVEGGASAYSQIAGAANPWTTTDGGIPGDPMPLVTLTGRPTTSLGTQSGRPPMSLGTLSGRPTTSLVFMPLPEAIWGDGGRVPDETLPSSRLSTLPQLHLDGGSSTYTKRALIAALTALMNAMQPDTIRTQDYVGTFGDGDHDDHHAAAYFARSAHRSYSVSHRFIGYLDYASADNRQNVSARDLTPKTTAYYAYLAWDSAPCGDPPDCGTNDYGHWLKRQYIIATEHSDPATAPPGGTGPI